MSPSAGLSNPEAVSLIQSTELFSACNVDQIDIIAQHSSFRDYGDGELIFAEADQGDQLFIVASGEVSIKKHDDDARQLALARFLSGDIIGELDMFISGKRSADAFADGPCRLLVFPDGETGFREILVRYPAVSASLLNSFLIQISARIRGVNALVGENSPIVRELKRQVYVDKLTGLNNKTLFEETLEHILEKADGTTALLMFKPDNFKEINDSYGHDDGDAALQVIAASLSDFLDRRDMLFRYMGNENAIILNDSSRETALEEAERIADFLRNLSLRKVLGTDDFRLSVSIGIGVAPEHGVDASRLIETVHPLPLAARSLGGNRILFPEDGRFLMITSLETLRQVDIFSSLEESELSRVRLLMKRHEIPSGWVLFRQGDYGQLMYVILAGKVSVTIRAHDNEELEVACVGIGSFFGEMSILEDVQRSATCRTIEDCILLSLGPAKVFEG